MYPYRTVPLVRNSKWWTRFVPKVFGSKHQWYRRGVGGQWTQEMTGELTPWGSPVLRWIKTDHCPGRRNFDQHGYDIPDSVCFTDVEIGVMKNHECCCEVWK